MAVEALLSDPGKESAALEWLKTLDANQVRALASQYDFEGWATTPVPALCEMLSKLAAVLVPGEIKAGCLGEVVDDIIAGYAFKTDER